MQFRLKDDCTDLRQKIGGVRLVYQKMLPGLEANDRLIIAWQTYFEPIELDAEFELWLTTAEAENLAVRLCDAVGLSAIAAEKRGVKWK